MPPLTDVTFGPLKFITVRGAVKEQLGEQLETVGAVVRPGERRPRPFALSLPIRAEGPRTVASKADAFRLRRQVKALIDNDAARAQAFWFQWAADPELAGWLLVGSAEIEQREGGPTMGEWSLSLSDCYRVATARSHREARALEVFDRRVATTPRDVLGRIFGGGFEARTARTVHALPSAVTELVAPSGRPLTVDETRGVASVVVGQPARAVVSFDRDPLAPDGGDVVCVDRQPTIARNAVPNPSFELTTDGWTFSASSPGQPLATLTRSGSNDTSGSWSGRYIVTRDDTAELVSVVIRTLTGTAGIPVSPGEEWTFRADAFRNGSSVGPGMRPIIYWFGADGTQVSSVSGDYQTGNAAKTFMMTATAPAGAAFAAVGITGTLPTAGTPVTFEVRVDSVSFCRTPAAYFDGDTPGAYWAGASHASPSVAPGAWEQIYGPVQPLTAGDVPVLSNGLCRVRWIPAQGVFAVDDQRGVEAARVGVLASGGYATVLKGCEVAECTAERTVLRVRLATSGTTRVDVYVTLQRGWFGPRIECYAASPAGLTAPSLIVSTSASAADPFIRSTGSGTITAGIDHGAWTGLEPWLHLAPAAGLHLVVAVTREADRLLGVSGTQLYGGAARTAAEIRGQADGYVSALVEVAATSAVATARRALAGQESLIDARQVRELVSRS